MGKAPTGNAPHAQRWYRHIASYSAQERNAWGGQALPQVAGAKPTTQAAAAADDDDDVDLFGSDDEEENAEAARIREERLTAYNAKKSKKPVLIAKSSVLLDVKPWDDEVIVASIIDHFGDELVAQSFLQLSLHFSVLSLSLSFNRPT